MKTRTAWSSSKSWFVFSWVVTTKMPSQKCSHQNALTKMLSAECPHQNALSRMPSPKCPHQNALTKMTSPSFQPPMASNVFRPGLMFLRSVNFLKEPLPQFSSRSLYSSRDLLVKQNQGVGRRESLKCPLCLSLPQIFIYFTSCCTSVETSKTIVKLLTIAGHFIPILWHIFIECSHALNEFDP